MKFILAPVIFLMVLFSALPVQAQPLSTQQMATLKAAINAETDPTFVGYRTNGQTGLMAGWYNGTLTPTVAAWNSACTGKQMDEGASYSTFDSIVAGKRDSWTLFLMYAPRDFTKARNRNTVTDVWGNATAASTAEAILQACTRSITRAESVLGGSTTAATGAVTARRLTWEGSISDTDINGALAQ